MPGELMALGQTSVSLREWRIGQSSKIEDGPEELAPLHSVSHISVSGDATRLHGLWYLPESVNAFGSERDYLSFSAPVFFGSEGGTHPLAPYRLQKVAWRGHCLRFQHEIACQWSFEDGLYVIRYRPLGIVAYAPSYQGALSDFQEEFLFIWDDYGKAPDEDLSPSGQRLKQRLLQLVQAEIPANAPA